MTIKEFQTNSLVETRELGKKIGTSLTAGTILALTGDLGSGKTSFVQGLARGLGVPDEYYITSPTYTLINEYPGRCPLFHVDLYRLEGPDDAEEIGLSEILCSDGVVAIEWAERLSGETLGEHIAIDFEILDDESRKICVSVHE
ncbi:tRNA (adenosine(37)-N6)-threonylcarbamoyltransferase complex ATPase subunit type 1 TsaE [Desulfobacterales bacterium HSG2]|nr:tRNA (adenosine(37)-N6)-threonylcarbamoyltransferase complex ATPase subunit type 1 TsaE [Desulfobacterales bacterium HSG2]